jgi:hypothetical protein
MSDKTKMQPNYLSIIEFKLLHGYINTPDDFDIENIKGHDVNLELKFGYNLEDKIAKALISIEVTAASNGIEKENAKLNYSLSFLYKVENMEELVFESKGGELKVDSALANALASVTYSTSRGILMTRLQGTAFQSFILPIINPNTLISHK